MSGDSTAGRNLLFGILALQNNFIDRAGLLDAFIRWTSGKSKSLGEILLDRRALKDDEFALLDALVAKHLERFGGNAQKSLESLSSIGSLRDDLSLVEDADLQASLVHVSTARKSLDTVAPSSLGASTSAGTRFRNPQASRQGKPGTGLGGARSRTRP